MALVKGGRYYQQSVRRNGRVTTHYYGVGYTVFAKMDDLIESKRKPERDELKAWGEEQDRLYREDAERGKKLRNLLTASLEALGFVFRDGKTWSKSTMEALPGKTAELSPIEARETIRKLVRRTANRQPGYVNKLHEMARAYPWQFAQEVNLEMWDLARCTLARDACPEDDKMREDLVARIDLVALELAGDNPSAARRLCAQVAAFAWAEHWTLSAAAAHLKIQQCHPKTVLRRNAAQKRFLTALKTIAQIAAAEVRPRRMVIMAQEG